MRAGLLCIDIEENCYNRSERKDKQYIERAIPMVMRDAVAARVLVMLEIAVVERWLCSCNVLGLRPVALLSRFSCELVLASNHRHAGVKVGAESIWPPYFSISWLGTHASLEKCK